MWSSPVLKLGLTGAAFFLCHLLTTVCLNPASSSDAHARSSRAGMSRACMRVPIIYCSSIETRLLAVSLDTTWYSSERALVSGCRHVRNLLPKTAVKYGVPSASL